MRGCASTWRRTSRNSLVRETPHVQTLWQLHNELDRSRYDPCATGRATGSAVQSEMWTRAPFARPSPLRDIKIVACPQPLSAASSWTRIRLSRPNSIDSTRPLPPQNGSVRDYQVNERIRFIASSTQPLGPLDWFLNVKMKELIVERWLPGNRTIRARFSTSHPNAKPHPLPWANILSPSLLTYINRIRSKRN